MLSTHEVPLVFVINEPRIPADAWHTCALLGDLSFLCAGLCPLLQVSLGGGYLLPIGISGVTRNPRVKSPS